MVFVQLKLLENYEKTVGWNGHEGQGNCSQNVNGKVHSVSLEKIFPRRKNPLDYDSDFSYLPLAQSRTCLWVSADPRIGEEIGKVPGINPSSRFSGQPEERGHLEATTVRAFLVSAGCP